VCFRYDEDLSVVYMAARLAGGYAAVRRALNEVMNGKVEVTGSLTLNGDTLSV